MLITAATPDMLQHGINATDAAVKAGLKWVVKISASDAREEGNVPWAIAHAVGNRYLKQQCEKHQQSWTILSPSGFMGKLLPSAPAIKKGLLPQTGGDGKAGWIDSKDITAVASQVLMDGPGKHHGQNYILTGPKLISFPEIAQALSRQVGHKVRYLHLPGPIFGLLLRSSGMDSWFADGLVAQFAEIVRQNDEGIEVSDATEKITGRPPTSIDDFAARNKEAFQGFDVLPYVGAVAIFAVPLFVRALF